MQRVGPLIVALVATLAMTACGPSFDASVSPEPFPIRAAYVLRSQGDDASAVVVFYDADVSCGALQNAEGCFPLESLPQHHELGIAIEEPGGVRAGHHEGSAVSAMESDDSSGGWQITAVSTSATVDLSETPADGEWAGTFTATLVPGSTRPRPTSGGITSGSSGGSGSTGSSGTTAGTTSTSSTGGSGSTGTGGGVSRTFEGSFRAQVCELPPRC